MVSPSSENTMSGAALGARDGADSGRASFDDLDKNAQTVVLDGFAAGADHLRLVLADCNETNKPRKRVV